MVVAARTCFSVCRALMGAPGTTAPCGSVTRPLTLAKLIASCACTVRTDATEQQAAITRQPHKPVFLTPHRGGRKNLPLHSYNLDPETPIPAGNPPLRTRVEAGFSPPGYPLGCQESQGRGGGARGVGRTSGADCARSGDERAMRSGRSTETPIGITAISVVSCVSGSDEQLHAS